MMRWAPIGGAIALVAGLACGCVATDGYGYGGGPDVGVGVDYYEPYGAVYGGWGGGYRVGPFPEGGHRRDDGGGGPARAYVSAPESHPVPSIPSRSRGGGGGGGHGGGGGGRR
jgi:hypothetical protein